MHASFFKPILQGSDGTIHRTKHRAKHATISWLLCRWAEEMLGQIHISTCLLGENSWSCKNPHTRQDSSISHRGESCVPRLPLAQTRHTLYEEICGHMVFVLSFTYRWIFVLCFMMMYFFVVFALHIQIPKLRRYFIYLDSKSIPKTPSQEVFRCLGIFHFVQFTPRDHFLLG